MDSYPAWASRVLESVRAPPPLLSQAVFTGQLAMGSNAQGKLGAADRQTASFHIDIGGSGSVDYGHTGVDQLREDDPGE